MNNIKGTKMYFMEIKIRKCKRKTFNLTFKLLFVTIVGHFSNKKWAIFNNQSINLTGFS